MGSHQLTLNQSRSLAEYLRMQTKLVIFTLLVCFFAGCYAPFPRNDWRSIFNPFIEPWWCRVSKETRESCMKHLLVVHWKRMDPVQFRAEGSMEEDKIIS